MRTSRLYRALALLTASVLLAAAPLHAGRKTQIQCEGREGYSFFVYVPDSYSEDNPAGIHMFFNGQGGCANNGDFGRWARTCEQHNLIGINMQYKDGDNARDTGGKVAGVSAPLH